MMVDKKNWHLLKYYCHIYIVHYSHLLGSLDENIVGFMLEEEDSKACFGPHIVFFGNYGQIEDLLHEVEEPQFF